MGGKTEVYNDIGAERIYKEDENLFAKEMIRYYGLNKKVDSYGFVSSIVQSYPKYFSVKLLEKLGVVATVSGTVEQITIESFKKHLAGIDTYVVPTAYYANEYSTADFTYYKFTQYLKDNWIEDQSLSQTYTVSFKNNISKEIYESRVCTNGSRVVTPKDIMVATGWNFDYVDFNVDFESYLYAENSGDTVYWMIDSFDSSTNIFTMAGYELVDGNWEPNGMTKYVDMPLDFRIMYGVYYLHRSNDYIDSDCNIDGGNWTVGTAIVHKEDLTPEEIHQEFMAVPIKAFGNFVENNKYQKAIMNDYGFKQDDFEESLSNPQIKEAFLTYTDSLVNNNILYADAMENVYGPKGQRNNLRITSDDYTIVYTAVEDNDGTSSGFDVAVNLTSARKGDDQKVYLIPVGIFDDAKLTFKEKYDFIRDTFCVYGVSSVTVEIKWYQTGFFKFVAFVISVLVSVITVGATAAVISAIMNIGMQIASSISPEIAKAIGVIMLVVGAYNAFTATAFELVDAATYSIRIAEFTLGEYSSTKVAELQREYDLYKNAEDQISAELEEMKGMYIYSPLDRIDVAYNTPYEIYDLQYNMYDVIYDYDFNFDKGYGL